MSWAAKFLFFAAISMLGSLLNPSLSFANEEKKAEAEAKPKEKDFSRDEEFSVIASRVQALEMKTKNAQDEIEKLIVEKNETKDPEKVAEIVAQMKKLHNTYQKSYHDWKKEESILSLRFPEKFLQNQKEEKKEEKHEEGAHGEGHKNPGEALTLDQMEKHVTLGGAVTSSVNKMRSHFKKKAPLKKADEPDAKAPKKDLKEKKPDAGDANSVPGVLQTPVLSK